MSEVIEVITTEILKAIAHSHISVIGDKDGLVLFDELIRGEGDEQLTAHAHGRCG